MENHIPLVSVLMTSYNREKYIAQSIESVLASTFTNFELLIVDDGSKDKTVEIAKSYAQKDNRIKVYVNEKNLGQFKNRNYGVELSKGKYIKYVDSDDLLYPTGLEVLVSMMEKFPEAGYGLCSLIQDDSRIYPFMLSPEESYKYNYFNTSIFHKAPLSSIIKKEAFDKVLGNEIEAVGGDYALWLKLSLSYPVVLMPDGIAWYRTHIDGEMQKARDSYIISFEYLKIEEYYLKQINFSFKKELLWRNKKKQYGFIKNILINKYQPLKAFQIYKVSKLPPQKVLKFLY